MTADVNADPPARRVVMVVSNGVDTDSRVVKTARSVAAAGWDAVVLGRSFGDAREEYDLPAAPSASAPTRDVPAGARVVKVPVPMAVSAFRKANPARGLVGRLGYRSADEVRARRDVQRARRGDLAVEDELARRRLAAGAPASTALRLRARRARLHAADRARGYWIEARRRLHDRAADRVQAPSGLGRFGLVLAVAVGRDGGGWRTHPELADLDAAFGPALDALAPDLIHAHDVDTLGLVVRAALRARRAGRTVRVVYDAHEYVAGVRRVDPSWSPAMLGQERKHIGIADGVVTVSAELAGLLRERYGLREIPAVVANAPVRAATGTATPDVRSRLGLDAEVPLLIYTGGVAPLRGLATVVEALPLLGDVGPSGGAHFAVVVGSRHRYVRELEDRAAELGVADRLHVLPYVEPDAVTSYVSTADAGVIPLLHTPAHEIAVCTKYYEFMHAGLPLVVSDMAAQAALTRELGAGEVFAAGDAASFAEAARRVLAEPKRYTAAYTEDVLARNSWEAQAPVLVDLYTRLLGPSPAARREEPATEGGPA